MLVTHEEFEPVSALSAGTASQNWLIQGDNLAVLETLGGELTSQVRCIYIDPPYNTAERWVHYADSSSHEQWLSDIEARLRALWPLLRDDGSLWISIDDGQMHYLKVLADSTLGRENFVTTIIWEHRTTRENRRVFSNNHEYLLVYAKNPRRFGATRNTLQPGADILARYRNPDGDPRGPWQSVSANVQAGHATPNQFYELVAPNGRRHTPPKGRCWAYTAERIQQLIADGAVYFGKDGNGVPRVKRYLADVKVGVTPETLWSSEFAGTTRSATRHLRDLFAEQSVFETPKPEQLIQRVLEIASDTNDLVLDAYLGAGTTAAVAHKMERRWVGIEVGPHAVTHCAARCKMVVEGEQGGISKDLRWHGGGGFHFFRHAGSALKAAA